MKKGNTVDYHNLYKMYSSNMYAYGMAFNIDKETILDAIHDVFLHIIENKKEIGTDSNVKFYLLVCLRNRLFSIKRKEIYTQSIDDNESNFSLMVISWKISLRMKRKEMN